MLALTVVFGFILIQGSMFLASWHNLPNIPPDLLEAETRLLRDGIVPDPDTILRMVAVGQQTSLIEDRAMLLSLAMLLMLVILSGWITARHLSRRIGTPMERVAVAARRLAGGDFTARADPSPGAAREAGQLVVDFNHMAASLQTLDRELTENAAAIAHELRTPLTILRGRLQGLKDGVFPPSGREFDRLITQVDGLTRLVEDLRTVSLASTGRLDLRRGPVDLAVDLDLLLDGMEPALEAAGLSLERDLRPAPLMGDGQRLRQATLALLENARRHAGGSVRVETRLVAGGGGRPVAILRVLDRGPGIAADPPDRVFERFWRADPSRSRDSGGSGLGLAVVRAIAEAHGGTAAAANRPDGGAVVELRLPGDAAR
jgi:two-component system sensor histidine kinase AdeS